jgi:tetratricopeptide (TPR) repeat protein
MKKFVIVFNILLCISVQLFAQTTVPKGMAADKALAAYSAANLNELAAAMPALSKEHPAHPYTIFLKAYLADRKDNNVAEALKGYSEVIKASPDLMEPYFFRAIIFNEKGMYEKAIDDMTNAIKNDDSKQSNLYTLRGEIYSKAEKNVEAFADFKQAIFISPAIAKNYRGLESTSFSIHKNEEAAAITKKAIESTESENAGVWAVWADINLRTKQFSVADKAFDKSISLSAAHSATTEQPDADTYNSAAIAALNTNNIPKAKKLSEKAVSVSPKDHIYYCNRAEISYSDKTWEEVYTWAQKALQLNTRSARANMLMAVGVKLTNRGDALSKQYQDKSKQLQAEGVQD